MKTTSEAPTKRGVYRICVDNGFFWADVFEHVDHGWGFYSFGYAEFRHWTPGTIRTVEPIEPPEMEK